MERVVSVVREGGAVLRLPPGFRFHPTDEELVEQYLLRKVMRRPLPASVVRDVELARFDPWDLPGDVLTAKERYLFNFREAKYRHGSRSNRAAGSGYWKATGRDRQVVGSRGDRVIGLKKVLVFHRGKPPHGQRTNWVMHEYRLATPAPAFAPAPCCAGEGPSMLLQGKKDSTANTGDWVLCRVFQKRSSSSSTMDADCEGSKEADAVDSREHSAAAGSGVRLIDFLRQRRDAVVYNPIPPPQRYQASDTETASCVTDASSESSSEEDGSSSPSCTLNLFTRVEP